MTLRCGTVRGLLSGLLDGDLGPGDARAAERHLAECGACRERWESLQRAQEALRDLPAVECAESIANRVCDRLDVESRGPGLRLLFRPAGAARPFMLPSLAPAALVLVCVVCGLLALGPGPEPLPPVTARLRGQPWGRLAPSGTESNPLLPGSEVSTPVLHDGSMIETEVARIVEGTFFVETVVARDGSVVAVTLLDGDSRTAQPVLRALWRETFEPARYRGRPVAVSMYRLISRTDVRAPLT